MYKIKGAVTAQLIYDFVFDYAEVKFSQEAAHILTYCGFAFVLKCSIKWTHCNQTMGLARAALIVACLGNGMFGG